MIQEEPTVRGERKYAVDGCRPCPADDQHTTSISGESTSSEGCELSVHLVFRSVPCLMELMNLLERPFFSSSFFCVSSSLSGLLLEPEEASPPTSRLFCGEVQACGMRFFTATPPFSGLHVLVLMRIICELLNANFPLDPTVYCSAWDLPVCYLCSLLLCRSFFFMQTLEAYIKRELQSVPHLSTMTKDCRPCRCCAPEPYKLSYHAFCFFRVNNTPLICVSADISGGFC